MATPHVSGVAALIMSAGNYTNQEVRDAMNTTALDLGSAGRDNSFGYGLVQAADAIAHLEDGGGNPPPTGITLAADGYRNRGRRNVDLTWSGAATVDIYRDGNLIASSISGTSYTDSLGRARGTFSYQVCEAGSNTNCSNSATVSF